MTLAFTGEAIGAPASTDTCLQIADDTERLRCYDTLSSRNTEKPDSSAPELSIGFLSDRIEEDADRKTLTLTARKPNYFMHTYLSDPNQEPYEFTEGSDQLDNSEIKFQLSFQTKLADNMFGQQADLWFSYTQVAYWQLYNDDISSPFRETNYEPEIYAAFLTNYKFLGLTGRSINFGFNHQSNGRSEPLSRSWNRVFTEFIFVRDDFGLSFKPWHRVEESSSDDDNPDIEDFLGHAYPVEFGRH